MLFFNFHPFPVLETRRLLLRSITPQDGAQVYALRSHPETMRYIPRPLLTSEQDAQAHIKMMEDKINQNEGINWAITLKDNPQLIGIIGHYRLQPENHRSEIGYMILPEFNGKGIATEAVACILEYGFEQMQLHSIEAVIDPQNYASEKVLLKNGFVKEAHLLENELFEGKFWDTVIYSLLKRNFRK